MSQQVYFRTNIDNKEFRQFIFYFVLDVDNNEDKPQFILECKIL